MILPTQLLSSVGYQLLRLFILPSYDESAALRGLAPESKHLFTTCRPILVRRAPLSCTDKPVINKLVHKARQNVEASIKTVNIYKDVKF